MPSQPCPSDEFVRCLTEAQSQLLGYIMASVGNFDDASDVLQQTNVVLLKKWNELRALEDFVPWAITVARFELLAFGRRRRRGELQFSPELSEAMAAIAAEEIGQMPARLEALRECLGRLPERNVGLLRSRYATDSSLEEIAQQMSCSVDSVKGRLKRVRRLLGDCIDRQLRAAGS